MRVPEADRQRKIDQKKGMFGAAAWTFPFLNHVIKSNNVLYRILYRILTILSIYLILRLKECENMIATNFSNVRNNFKEVCDRVVHDSDIAIITRKNDENVVLMSQAQYDNLMENLHIRESKANYEWLKESVKQAEDGKLLNFEVED